MNQRAHLAGAFACTLIVALAAAGCESKEARVKRHVSNGDAYEAKRQYAEAIIEYRNAIKAEPTLADVQLKLGRTYLKAGDAADAVQAMARAADMRPNDADLQIEAGALQLLAGDIRGAESRAQMLLNRQPRHVEAHVLLGNAQAASRRLDDARATLERAVRLDPSSADALAALGSLYLSMGNRAKAESTLRRAVDLSPKAENARLALANYYWLTGDRISAEKQLQDAVAATPKSSVAQYALAMLLERSGRAPEAERHYKSLADSGGAAARLALADYYLRRGKADAAIATAEPVRADSVRGEQAGLIVARAQLQRQRVTDAMVILDQLIKKDSHNVDARLLKARVLLDEKGKGVDPDGALKQARAAVKAAPEYAEAHYVLGLAQQRTKADGDAEESFKRAVKLDPSHAGAELEISRLALARGDAARALEAAERAASFPDRKAAGSQLALSLAAAGKLPQARQVIGELTRAFPDDAALQFEQARIALAERDYAAARASFEKVNEKHPDSIDAFEGLVTVDVATGRAEAAAARIAQRIQAAPNDARYRVLAARLEASRNRPDAAIASLRQAVAQDGKNIDAYLLLGQLYASRGQLPQAEIELKRLVAARPDAAASARTMLGIVQQMQGRNAEAAAQYEAALRADADAMVAANNLAWLYTEQGRFDEALALAERAAAKMPSRPEAHDTLGWVYYRKGLPMHAAPAFEKSAALAPQNPMYAYHLGLAYAKADRRADARRQLQRAISLGGNAEWIPDARAQLAKLDQPQKPNGTNASNSRGSD